MHLEPLLMSMDYHYWCQSVLFIPPLIPKEFPEFLEFDKEFLEFREFDMEIQELTS